MHGQGQKSEQKHTTKDIGGFHNSSPLLTMIEVNVVTHISKLKGVVGVEEMTNKTN